MCYFFDSFSHLFLFVFEFITFTAGSLTVVVDSGLLFLLRLFSVFFAFFASFVGLVCFFFSFFAAVYFKTLAFNAKS